jgi:ABC-2 type transport system ATP-binding protein
MQSQTPRKIIGIEVKNIKKKLGSNQALNDISTHFEEGLLHGIIGPEGAGKTTLLRSILSLLTPDEGSIQFTNHGKVIDYQSIRSNIAYMPQQQSLYSDLSISEHLDFFRDLYQIPENIYLKRREELLHITRLDKFVDRPAGKLSGGMYKKLGLMCALLQSPAAILLDEPTNGVDPISRREFWDLLNRLSKEKILIIFATAYMDEAERCDRVHILSSGSLIAEGTPRGVLEKEKVENYDALFIKKAAEGIL